MRAFPFQRSVLLQVAIGFLFFLFYPVWFAHSEYIEKKYTAIVAALKAATQAFPQYAELVELGENDHGDTILGLKIEKIAGSLRSEDKPAMLVMAGQHGSEQQSVTLALEFTSRLLSILSVVDQGPYQKLSEYIFYVIPVLSIEGYNQNSRWEKDRDGLYVDPNRDYPDPCGKDKKNYRLSSSRRLADWVRDKAIVGSVSIHGYFGSFTYPWGTFTSDFQTLDDSKYRDIAKKVTIKNGYKAGTHAQVIYPTTGAFEDWAYYKYGVWSMLLEIKKDPKREDLLKDVDAILTYFSLIPTERSFRHQHTGKCQTSAVSPEALESIPSRP